MKTTAQRSVQRATPSELAISAQSKEWKQRPHHAPRRLTSFLVVLAALAACVIVAVVQIKDRLVKYDEVALDRVTVTVDPVILISTASGRILDLKTKVGATVKAGDVLATIEVQPASSQGEKLDVMAPVDGIVQAVTAPAGGTVASGAPFITLYEPGRLFFESPLGYKVASDIRVGSKASFDVPGLGTIDATVAGVRSDFTTDVDQPNVRSARLVLQPADPASLQAVVPGLIAKGRIFTDTAAADAPRAVLNPKF